MAADRATRQRRLFSGRAERRRGGIATLYGESLAKLSAELDEIPIYCGRADEECAKKNGKPAAIKATQAAAVLRRAGCVASESGEASLKGGNELIEDAVSGRVGLDARPGAARPLCANRPPRSG